MFTIAKGNSENDRKIIFHVHVSPFDISTVVFEFILFFFEIENRDQIRPNFLA